MPTAVVAAQGDGDGSDGARRHVPPGARDLPPHINRGIGKGQARASELATRDARAATVVCGVVGCCALADVYWVKRHAVQAGRSTVQPQDGCGVCKGGRWAQWVSGQRSMAAQLLAGRRRLVRRLEAVDASPSRETWDLPMATVRAKVARALQRVAERQRQRSSHRLRGRASSAARRVRR